MIKTSSDLIDALGGNTEVAALLDVGISAISNYRNTGFPAWTHRRLLEECAKRRIKAADALFVAEKPGPRKRKAGSRHAAA